MENDIKIFQMNENDYVAARTLEEAKQCLADLLNNGLMNEEFEKECIDEPHELTELDLDYRVMHDEHGNQTGTFNECLAEMIKDGETFPAYFASSEY